MVPFTSNLFDGFVDFISIDIFQLEFGSDMVLDFLPFSKNALLPPWSTVIISILLLVILIHRLNVA